MSAESYCGRIASFHVAEFPLRRSFSRLVSLAAERWELPTTSGCVLGKVLGTSRKDTTRTSVDLRRWALFAVWEDDSAYETFMATSSLMDRWRSQSTSSNHFKLRPISSRGSWGGVDPLSGSPASNGSRDAPGRVAVLTRASVRARHLATFTRAVPRVDDALWRQPGCEMALGMGEWPIGQQATFSIWKSYADVRAFAHDGAEHSEVIRRTYRENWYSEELFARFDVL